MRCIRLNKLRSIYSFAADGFCAAQNKMSLEKTFVVVQIRNTVGTLYKQSTIQLSYWCKQKK